MHEYSIEPCYFSSALESQRQTCLYKIEKSWEMSQASDKISDNVLESYRHQCSVMLCSKLITKDQHEVEGAYSWCSLAALISGLCPWEGKSRLVKMEMLL